MRQVGEEGLQATGEPLHALMEVGQSLQVTDVAQDLVLGDQLVSEVPGEHLRLLGKRRPVRCTESAGEYKDVRHFLLAKKKHQLAVTRTAKHAFSKTTAIREKAIICLMNRRYDG